MRRRHESVMETRYSRRQDSVGKDERCQQTQRGGEAFRAGRATPVVTGVMLGARPGFLVGMHRHAIRFAVIRVQGGSSGVRGRGCERR